MPISLSVRTEQLGCHWADFVKIVYLSTFRKHVEKIQIALTLILLTWRIW